MAKVPGEKRKRRSSHRSTVMTVVVLIIGLIVGMESFSITYKYMLEDEKESSSEDNFTANALMDWFQSNSINTDIDGMIKSINKEENKITLLSMRNNTDIELTVNNNTIYPKRVSEETGATVKMGLGDFMPGDFITFVYDKNKVLTEIKKCQVHSDDSGEEGYWEYSDTGCTVVEKNKLVNFFSEDNAEDRSYNYDKTNIIVLYGDKNMTINDVSPLDFVTVRGYTKGSKKKVYAVKITRGHGQLVFRNYSSLLEGKLHIESISDADEVSDEQTLQEEQQAAEAQASDIPESFWFSEEDKLAGKSSEEESTDNVYDSAAEDTYTYSADFELAEKSTYDFVEGKYLIKITSKNCVDFEQEINITPTSPCSIDLSKIELKKGKLTVSVNVDDFSLFVDDRPVEEGQQIELEYGQHKVTVTKSGYTTFSENVSLYEPQVNVPVDMVIKPKLGYINITVSPANASVYVDGKKVGTGSVKADVKVGTHSVTAKAEGYTSDGRNVTVNKEGEVVDCGIVLEKTKKTEKTQIKTQNSEGTQQPSNNTNSTSNSNNTSNSSNTGGTGSQSSNTPTQSQNSGTQGGGSTSTAPNRIEQQAQPLTNPPVPSEVQPDQSQVPEHDPVEDILIDENSGAGAQ